MLTTPKARGGLFLASSLCDGLEDNNIKQVTTLLLNKEADPNILIPTHGVTPFHLVIGNDSEVFAEEVTKLFLRHGGNPNVKSVDGLTPVHVAAAWGRIKVLELLLANGGDPLCLDDEGRSPFHYAFDGKYYKAVTVLGRYCEDNTEENEKTNYTIAFDKLLINNGNVMAEYVTKNSDTNKEDTWCENKSKHIKEIVNNLNEFSFTSSGIDSKLSTTNESELNTAELQVHKVIEQEKCLVSEIINQLSTSLKSKSKKEVAKEQEVFKQNSYDSNVSCRISTDESISYDRKEKFNLKKRMKKRSTTSRYRQATFTQNINNDNQKLSPIFMYDPNDSIVSKSPNFILPPKMSATEKKYFSPRTLYTKTEFKTNTPCIERHEPLYFEDCHAVKNMARSTPRRKKKFYKRCTPVRTFNKHYKLDLENTSPDSIPSLSPDQDHSRILDYKFNKNLAIKLDENMYDEDGPLNSSKEQINNLRGCSEGKASKLVSNKAFIKINELSKITLEKELYQDVKHKRERIKNLKVEKADVKNEFNMNTKYILESSGTESCNASFLSVQEEYKYKDLSEGVALLERRIYPVSSCIPTEDDVSSTENIKSLPKSLNLQMDLMSNESLRKKLINLNYVPGPITNSTRSVYLKKFTNLAIKTSNLPSRSSKSSIKDSEKSPRIDRIIGFMEYGNWVDQLDTYRILEKKVFEEFFFTDPSRKWREGTNKTSFNYLLLDSRITKDLPCRFMYLSESEIWHTFLSAIFYIGKGKLSRPHSHLYDAFNAWVYKKNSLSKKIEHILDIWNAGYGVICLYGFQNIIPVEAYTREAAMIDALGLKQLSNCKSGDYYGLMATWTVKEKREFGRYLLYKMLQILMYEGERQIFPEQL